MKIDTEYLVYTDANGKDPDIFSLSLKKYNQLLWSKKLPCGSNFELRADKSGAYLYHKSKLGEFFLSSDTITHTYSKWKKLSHIIKKIPNHEINFFLNSCSKVSSHLIFPSKRFDGKMNINGARGINSKICDRFDLTLECIRCFYLKKENPLQEVLLRYSDFFKLFHNFKGYVDFFLLQDLVCNNYEKINFFLTFDNFNRSSVPTNLEEYLAYKNEVLKFINARSKRINEYQLKLL